MSEIRLSRRCADGSIERTEPFPGLADAMIEMVDRNLQLETGSPPWAVERAGHPVEVPTLLAAAADEIDRLRAAAEIAGAAHG